MDARSDGACRTAGLHVRAHSEGSSREGASTAVCNRDKPTIVPSHSESSLEDLLVASKFDVAAQKTSAMLTLLVPIRRLVYARTAPGFSGFPAKLLIPVFGTLVAANQLGGKFSERRLRKQSASHSD